jgi:hypothetical protein
VGAGPEVGGGPRLGDEILYRSQADREQRGIALGVCEEGAREGGGEIQVLPDGVIGHPGVRGQQPPELSQPGVLA